MVSARPSSAAVGVMDFRGIRALANPWFWVLVSTAALVLWGLL